MDLLRLLELARLCLQFGRVNRVTFHEDAQTPESDTDHTVMLSMLACELAQKINRQATVDLKLTRRYGSCVCGDCLIANGFRFLDLGLIAQFSQVHDFVEVWAGDTNTMGIGAEGAAAKDKREAEALERLRARFGAESWVISTIERYERLDTPEARFVKTLDKVLPKITHILSSCKDLRRRGIGPERIAEVNEAQLAKMRTSYAADQPEALAFYEEIHGQLVEMLRQVPKSPGPDSGHGENCAADRSPDCIPPPGPCNCRLSAKKRVVDGKDCYRGCPKCDGSSTCPCVPCHKEYK